MVGLLASVTIFEGYDVTIFHLCTPDIARTFHMSDLDVGAMASIVRLGEMMAFVVVMPPIGSAASQSFRTRCSSIRCSR